ncbi:MAG: hypothetical protein COB04_06070 [Gammaproteobacteria bacterium]|nr:MAG: hypothetical protein COB04_06070 [Gammaproteobacteria bacterium]
MKNRLLSELVVGGVLVASSSTIFAEGSPWLPAPGSTTIAIESAFQTADDFYIGSDKESLGGDVEQLNYGLSVEYGVLDNLSVDARLSYATSEQEGTSTKRRDFADSSIGLTWRLVDEFIFSEYAPSVGVRVAAIIAGDYEVGTIDAIGEGASGVDASLLVGKYVTDKLAFSGELGYRVRDSDVPDDVFYNLSASYLINSTVNVFLGLQGVSSNGDFDIGDDDSGRAVEFSEVQENSIQVDFGFAASITHAVSIAANCSSVIDGRNTFAGKACVLSAGYTF